VRDLAEALSALHAQAGGLGEAGLGAFGGFTPDSVLVGTDGRARLMDALVSGAANRATAVRAHADRIAYTAPELLADVAAGANDPRGDVFALGVLLWELLAKRRLFTGRGGDLEQQVRSLEVPRLDSLGGHERARISPALVEVVAQALERDPRARPQDMAELIAAVVATGADCARPRRSAPTWRRWRGATSSASGTPSIRPPLPPSAPRGPGWLEPRSAPRRRGRSRVSSGLRRRASRVQSPGS
jgi:serine/threonine-protein kinase